MNPTAQHVKLRAIDYLTFWAGNILLNLNKKLKKCIGTNLKIKMIEKELISIITINYNNVEGLKKTMTSVFEQTSKDFEYIIIDGGSTDGSAAFIESQNDKLTYWVSEPDTGIFNAMNKGILKSKGRYLQFLNSGDWLFDENVLDLISSKLVDCDILYGNVIKVRPNGENYLEKSPQEKDITLDTFFKGTISHGASFIKRNLFNKYGLYDEELKIVSDWKFFLIALGLNNSKLKFIDSEVLFFDMTGVSNTNINLRESERHQVLTEIVPNPIYADYNELMIAKTSFRSNRFKMLLELENFKFARKVNHLVFRILLLIYKNKK
jgi:glycosyltransferase involved in cell wall biosynthesis